MIDTLKDAASLVQKADNIELYRLLLQAQQEALGLVQDKHALNEEVRALREEVRTLKSRMGFSDSLTRQDGKYFAKGDPDPYCPKCWEVDQVAIHLVRHRDHAWDCLQCKSVVR